MKRKKELEDPPCKLPSDEAPHKVLKLLLDAGAVSKEKAIDASIILSAMSIINDVAPASIWASIRTLMKDKLIDRDGDGKDSNKYWILAEGQRALDSSETKGEEARSKDDTQSLPQRKKEAQEDRGYERFMQENADSVIGTVRETGSTGGLVGNIGGLTRTGSLNAAPSLNHNRVYKTISEAISCKVVRKMKQIYGNIYEDPRFEKALFAVLLVLYQGNAFSVDSALASWETYYRANYLVDFSVFTSGSRLAEDAAIYGNLGASYIGFPEHGHRVYYLTPEGIGYVERALEKDSENRKLLDKVQFITERDAKMREKKLLSKKKLTQGGEKEVSESSKEQFSQQKRKSPQDVARLLIKLLEDDKRGIPSAKPAKLLLSYKRHGDMTEEEYQKEMREFAEKAFRDKYGFKSVPELFSFERKASYDDDDHLPQIVGLKMLIDKSNDQKTTDAIVSVFKENEIQTEVRELPAGSFMWVGLDNNGNEYVLNAVIERVTIVEYCILLKDKLKMSRKLLEATHMINLAFIIEGNGTIPENKNDVVFFNLHKSLQDVCDTDIFSLIRTANFDETLVYLFSLTDQLMQEIRDGYGKGLLFWPGVTFRTLNAFVQTDSGSKKRYTGSLLQDTIDKFSFNDLKPSMF